jgi:hypothetical protein
MLFMPLNLPGETILVVILERDNLERMKTGDPVTLESGPRGGLVPTLVYPENTSLLIAYEEDSAVIYEMASRKDFAGIVRHLERGRQWKPGFDGVQWARSLSKLQGGKDS